MENKVFFLIRRSLCQIGIRGVAMSEREDKITIELSQNEALVLFEFLSRFSDEAELHIEDQAEERVLWDMCCVLEKHLVQPFSPDYEALLEKARADVRDRDIEGTG